MSLWGKPIYLGNSGIQPITIDLKTYSVDNTNIATGRRISGFQADSGDRVGQKDTKYLYYDPNNSNMAFSLGSSMAYNYATCIGPIPTVGYSKVIVKYLPIVFRVSTWGASNLYLCNSSAGDRNYSPSASFKQVSLGGKDYTKSYYENLYGSDFVTDVQHNPNHQAWLIDETDISGKSSIYVWIHACDMDSFIQSISLL